MPRPLAPEIKSAVLADVPDLGISRTALKHGVGKATVSRLAKQAGIGTFQDQTREATEARQRTIEERRAVVTDRLWEIADKATVRELELLRAEGLHAVVGARTRAIHDAELLSGRATARTEHVEPIDAEIARLVEQLTP